MAARVAPSRVRGLKQQLLQQFNVIIGRTLTGAWIETIPGQWLRSKPSVAPSRVRGLKQFLIEVTIESIRSHPHGCVD